MFGGRKQFAEKRPRWLVTGTWRVLSGCVLNSNLCFSFALAAKGRFGCSQTISPKATKMDVTESQGQEGLQGICYQAV